MVFRHRGVNSSVTLRNVMWLSMQPVLQIYRWVYEEECTDEPSYPWRIHEIPSAILDRLFHSVHDSYDWAKHKLWYSHIKNTKEILKSCLRMALRYGPSCLLYCVVLSVLKCPSVDNATYWRSFRVQAVWSIPCTKLEATLHPEPS